MKDERGWVAHCFLPILTILPCGGNPLPEERKPTLFPMIPVDRLQLVITARFLMVVINGKNLAQEVVFGPFWPKTEFSPPETWHSPVGIDPNTRSTTIPPPHALWASIPSDA